MKQFNLELPVGITWIQVISSSGSPVGDDGTSDSVTNRLDRELLVAARNEADWILVSGRTFLSERYKASRRAPIAVITGSSQTARDVEALIAQNQPIDEGKPITLFKSVDEFLTEAGGAEANKILLESGRTMAKSLLNLGYLTGAIVSVTGDLTDSGKKAIDALCHDLGASKSHFQLKFEVAELRIWAYQSTL